MESRVERLLERVERETRRLAQARARELLREQRNAMFQRAAARRAEQQRRVDLGNAVSMAGCGDWDVMEIVGTLVDARERFGSSSTQRLGMRKRGEAHLSGRASQATELNIH